MLRLADRYADGWNWWTWPRIRGQAHDRRLVSGRVSVIDPRWIRAHPVRLIQSRIARPASTVHRVLRRHDLVRRYVARKWTTMSQNGPRSAFLRERLGAFEFERNHSLVADNPRVVTGLDHIRVTGSGLSLAAVCVGNVEATADDRTDMP